MSPQRYILREKKIMERECRQKGISPFEWVSKYANSYHRKHASKVLSPCFDGYK